MNAPTREEFLAQRMRGLGGSDIGSILGVNKWKSPVAVWMDKTGRAERDEHRGASAEGDPGSKSVLDIHRVTP